MAIYGNIRDVVRDNPIEDGVVHMAEDMLREYVLEHKEDTVDIIFRKNEPTVELIQLLGRIPEVDKVTKTKLVIVGLQSKDILIRDATIQAVELWADEDLVPFLMQHQDDDAVLSDYITRVIRDISSGRL